MLEHHRELILIAPVFLALGFVGGFLARSWVRRPRVRVQTGALDAYAVFRGILIVFGVYLAVALLEIAARLSMQSSSRLEFPLSLRDLYGIHIYAFVVGGAAGWWFRSASSSREKAAFVFAAAVFLVLVALEYDTKIFGRISKFEAGGVGLELSSSKRELGPVQRGYDQSQPGDPEAAAFPRTSQIDAALNALYLIGQNAIRENHYAVTLWAGENNGSSAEEMDEPRKAFTYYACKRIEPLAGQLYKLQQFHRSESSALAVDPRLVALLRRAYYDRLNDYRRRKLDLHYDRSTLLQVGSASFQTDL